jgi:hypothetical protein
VDGSALRTEIGQWHQDAFAALAADGKPALHLDTSPRDSP